MAGSREAKQECDECGEMLVTSRIYIHRQRNLCKKCIKIDRGRPAKPTDSDREYHQMLRKQRGLV